MGPHLLHLAVAAAATPAPNNPVPNTGLNTTGITGLLTTLICFGLLLAVFMRTRKAQEGNVGKDAAVFACVLILLGSVGAIAAVATLTETGRAIITFIFRTGA